MRRAPKLVTKPATMPVTLDEVKSYCGVSGADQDAKLELLIASATSRLEGYSGRLGRVLINQTWSRDFDICAKHRLPFPDVHEATAVILDAEGETDPVDIRLDEDVISPFVCIVGSYSGNACLLRVTFTAGYGDAPADVPAPIREAILVDVAHRLRLSGDESQIRSETVEGIGVTAFNSPEQAALAVERQIAVLLKDYRRGNV